MFKQGAATEHSSIERVKREVAEQSVLKENFSIQNEKITENFSLKDKAKIIQKYNEEILKSQESSSSKVNE